MSQINEERELELRNIAADVILSEGLLSAKSQLGDGIQHDYELTPEETRHVVALIQGATVRINYAQDGLDHE